MAKIGHPKGSGKWWKVSEKSRNCGNLVTVNLVIFARIFFHK